MAANLEPETAPREDSPSGSDSEEGTADANDGAGEVSGPSVAAAIPEGMSKNQWKKLRKQRLKEQTRKEWRQKQREKDREKRRKRKLEGVSVPERFKKKKRSADVMETSSNIRVAIDLGYEHLMGDKDIKMVVKQCQRCYSVNRRADSPLQFYLTSFGGQCKQRMDSILQGYQHWNVQFRPENYIDEFGKDNVVFLAAESPNILSDLDPSKVYIIGGLVDHNHHKGYCYRMAQESGVAHAQLPISEYVKLNCRNVLAINHVFEILLGFVQCKDWEKAFYDVIPQRKLVAAKDDIGHISPTAACTDTSRPCDSTSLCLEQEEACEKQIGPSPSGDRVPVAADSSGRLTDPSGCDLTLQSGDSAGGSLSASQSCERQIGSSPSGDRVPVAADSSGRLTDPSACDSDLQPGDGAGGSLSASQSGGTGDLSPARGEPGAVVIHYMDDT